MPTNDRGEWSWKKALLVASLMAGSWALVLGAAALVRPLSRAWFGG